jgi:chromosome segregation ATPase
MGSLLNWGKLGLVLLILAIGFSGGYALGAWKKNKLEQQLQTITEANVLIEKQLAKKNKQLVIQLEQIKGDYLTQAEINKKNFKQEREKLAKKLNDSEKKLANLSTYLGETNRQLKQIENQLTTATGQHKQALAQQRNLLIIEKNKFEQEKASWSCLDTLLPDFGESL